MKKSTIVILCILLLAPFACACVCDNPRGLMRFFCGDYLPPVIEYDPGFGSYEQHRQSIIDSHTPSSSDDSSDVDIVVSDGSGVGSLGSDRGGTMTKHYWVVDSEFSSDSGMCAVAHKRLVFVGINSSVDLFNTRTTWCVSSARYCADCTSAWTKWGVIGSVIL